MPTLIMIPPELKQDKMYIRQTLRATFIGSLSRHLVVPPQHGLKGGPHATDCQPEGLRVIVLVLVSNKPVITANAL